MSTTERATQTAERRDGLHCVYGTCQGLPCNPGCSFTMTCVNDLEIWRRQATEVAPDPKATALANTINQARVWKEIAEANADEIERLRADLAMLHCLDVTAREGQRVFAAWRNRSVKNGR